MHANTLIGPLRKKLKFSNPALARKFWGGRLPAAKNSLCACFRSKNTSVRAAWQLMSVTERFFNIIPFNNRSNFRAVKRRLLFDHVRSSLVLVPNPCFLYSFCAGGGQPEPDPHRPPCNSSQCHKVKSFVKSHYCGAPEGNGPDDSCEIQQPKKRLKVKVTASYDCKWVDGVRNCKQQGEPTAALRGILVGELKDIGLPVKAKGPIYFTVWQPVGFDWALVEAYYDHIEQSDVALCQVIAIVGQNSHVSVLRKVPFQKTDADKNTVTTWSLLDLADVNADGQTEVILEGDAYEDHWIEVVGMTDGSFKTIFAGLGYYL